jgi:predicted metal-dependent hydrolase
MKAGGVEHGEPKTRKRTGLGNSWLYPAQELRRRAMAWAVTLRVNPKAIRVQEMRRKWGSCSSNGTVTFASDLTEQDKGFQNYVIVHELLHLRVPTHGRVFKALMTAHVPGWYKFERPQGASRRQGGPPDHGP